MTSPIPSRAGTEHQAILSAYEYSLKRRLLVLTVREKLLNAKLANLEAKCSHGNLNHNRRHSA